MSLQGPRRFQKQGTRQIWGRAALLYLPQLALSMVTTRFQVVAPLALSSGIQPVTRAFLIAEQNLRLALDIADRVYVLERGEIVHEAPAAEFRNDSARQLRFLGV